MNLFVYGAGGFGREVMDLARRLNRSHARWNHIAYLDDQPGGQSLYGAEVFPFEAALQRCGVEEMEVVIANGEPFVRKALAERCASAGVGLATLVDGGAVVSETAVLAAGTIVFPGCFVSSQTQIGNNVGIIAGSNIGHDSVIGDHSMIAGQVNIGGACRIGTETYIAMGAQLRERIRIGRGSVIGMGSVVFGDIPDEVIALGNPCRALRAHTTQRVFG